MPDLKSRLPSTLDEAALQFVARVGRRRGVFGPAGRMIDNGRDGAPDGDTHATPAGTKP